MPITNEQLTIIRAGLDASAYQTGANVVMAANQQMAASGAPVVAATDNNVRAYLGLQRQIESFRRATIDGYTETAKFAQIQDTLTRAVNLAQISTGDANQILATYAERFQLVSAQAKIAAQAIQDVQIQSLAAADAMQRASQAQAAYNARSGSPGTSAPVAGAGYGTSAGGGNPLYGDVAASRQADLDAYGAAMDSVRAKYVPLFAAQQQYESELAAISEAVNVGAISETEAAAAREKTTQAYLDARDAANAYAIAQRDAAAADAQQQASQAQAAYNSRSGALGSNPLYGAAYDARQGDLEAAFADSDKQRAAVDDLYAASKRYESVLEQIQALNRTGVFSDAQTQAAMDKATTNYANQANMAGSLGLAIDKTNQTAGGAAHGLTAFGNGSAFATRELIVMGDEILRGNFSRIPGSMLVLTSHVQVLRESLIGLVTSAAGLSIIGGLAIAGGLVAFSVAAESNNRQVEALQNRLSLVRSDYVATGDAALKAAAAMAKSTGDTTADARTGATSLYSSKAFAGTAQDATAITSTFYELSKALGDTTTDWARMTQALNDPAALLKSLQGQIGDINQVLIDQVTRLQNSGDKAAAFAVVLQTLQDATKHVTENQTPLETALRLVDGMFVQADGHGNTLTKTIGGFGTQAATGAVYAFGIIVLEISKLSTALDALEKSFEDFFGPSFTSVIKSIGTALDSALNPVQRVLNDFKLIKGLMSSGGGNSGSNPGSPGTPGAPQITSNADINAQAQAMIHFEAMNDKFSETIETFSTHIAQVESHGMQYGGPGSVRGPNDVTTSGAGALGIMQVMPDQSGGTTKTINGTVYDLTDTAQNISAGMHMIADLFKQFNGDEYKVAAGYNSNPGKVNDRVANGTLPAETVTYEQRMGLVPGGTVAPVPAAPPGQAASDSSTGQGTYGVINPAQDVLGDALKLTGGTAASQAETLQDKITLLNKALAQTGNSSADIAKLTQELQKAQLEMYNAVPAATGLYRAVDIQTTAEAKLAGAWTQGAAAVERLTVTTKAEAEARTAAAPGTAAYAQVVAGLTAKYLALAAATQDVTLAQKTSANQDSITYLQAENSSLAMNDEQRTLMLAHLKEELDLKRTAPNADGQYVSGLLASTDAIAKNTYELNQNKQSLSEVSGVAGTAFDSIGTAVSQSLVASKGAIVDWGNVMTTIIQQIIQEMLKLAVINPILNEAFGGSRSTISNIGGAFGGGTTSGGSAVGGALGGVGGFLKMTPGDAFSSLFGGGATTVAAVQAADPAAYAGMLSGLGAGTPDLLTAAGGFLHAGGFVGPGMPMRTYPASAFNNAPRYHSGLASDEFATILQRGEQVLTAKQAQTNAAVLKQATGSGGSGGNTTVNHWNITTPDVDGFARSKGQVMALATKAMIRQMAK